MTRKRISAAFMVCALFSAVQYAMAQPSVTIPVTQSDHAADSTFDGSVNAIDVFAFFFTEEISFVDLENDSRTTHMKFDPHVRNGQFRTNGRIVWIGEEAYGPEHRWDSLPQTQQLRFLPDSYINEYAQEHGISYREAVEFFLGGPPPPAAGIGDAIDYHIVDFEETESEMIAFGSGNARTDNSLVVEWPRISEGQYQVISIAVGSPRFRIGNYISFPASTVRKRSAEVRRIVFVSDKLLGQTYHILDPENSYPPGRYGSVGHLIRDVVHEEHDAEALVRLFAPSHGFDFSEYWAVHGTVYVPYRATAIPSGFESVALLLHMDQPREGEAPDVRSIRAEVVVE